MINKRLPLITEEPKHKKKSKAKGQPRADHKQSYETVLLIRDYHSTDFKTGKPTVHRTQMPTKVCVICGRVSEVEDDASYYKVSKCNNIPWIYSKELSEKALALPKWYLSDYFDKFATKYSENV